MRDRKIKIIVLLVVLVMGLLLTIGFAAFSNTLFIRNEVSFNPDSSNFSVKFSTNSSRYVPGSVAPAKSPSSISANSATISNTTASNLQAVLNDPGQKVTYTFYAVNTGNYDAHLTGIKFNNATGASSFKKCTAGANTNTSLVQSACESIKVTAKVGDFETSSTNDSIAGHVLTKGSYETVTITLEYLENGAVADGTFTVDFGDITFTYSTVGVETSSQNSCFAYTTSGNEVTITGYGVETPTFRSLCGRNIEIPSQINGKTVTSISANAFDASRNSYWHAFDSLTIPSTITYIGDYAFYEQYISQVIIRGKSSESDFSYFGEHAFDYHDGGSEYYTNNIIWD